MMSLQKRIALLIGTAVVGLSLRTLLNYDSHQETSFQGTIDSQEVIYETNGLNNILEVHYQSGTTEKYIDALSDSTVDLITIIDPTNHGFFYSRMNASQRPMIQLGQTVFDKYLAEINKEKCKQNRDH